MDLILWRHAEAGEAGPESELDRARPLTSRGVKQAERAAEWLNRYLPQSTRILCSPAVRCVQTADKLERRYKIVEALGPEGSVEALLHAARWPDAKEPVLVIGHQPVLGTTAAYLMTGGAEGGAGTVPPWSVKKGSVWWLRHRPREGRAEVVIVAVRSPEGL
jgi:phosphohistidine phosphatase